MDQETFSQRVLAQQRRLYRIAVSYLASSADAEDAMQEALLRAWRRRNTLRDMSHFDAWLTRILVNECRTILRARKRQMPVAELPLLTTPAPDERSMDVRRALFALPEKYRMPLILTCLEGYTLQETAVLLSMPLGTVKTRVARAKKKLEEEVAFDAQ